MSILHFIFLINYVIYVCCQNLEYLDPAKLQTKTSAAVQERTAKELLKKFFGQYKLKNPIQWQSDHAYENVNITVDRSLFVDNKDSFQFVAADNKLKIKASTGVAALWGFHYYMKKYCKSHYGWRVQRMSCPSPLPEGEETVVANDRFRYYQNVCTASYSFLWWRPADWTRHVLWMAFNGINLALAPVAQEAAWKRVYKRLTMTDEQIDDHFTGPAFLSWHRMGHLRGWGGPLYDSWHSVQEANQVSTMELMKNLGMVPVLPSFAGHVPRALEMIFRDVTFLKYKSWFNFSEDHCCGLFLDPNEALFKEIGSMFMAEVTSLSKGNHIFTAEPFNEIVFRKTNLSKSFIESTAKAIFSVMNDSDEKAVWLLQNWMFVRDTVRWPKENVKAFLTSVPNGRMLILDLQSEQWPQYDLYDMYFGQPFIWCMLHNFGGTMGMFGSMDTINTVVYGVRNRVNNTMIGIGLTPEGINQNYVVYDLMLESAWRKGPADLNDWAADYAERRYGCNQTAEGWKYLVRSVYNFTGYNKMRGKYVVTRTPSFWLKPWAWYSSKDLFNAFREFAFADCSGPGFEHDLVDVTRQALQYRAEQLYIQVVSAKNSNDWVFEKSVHRFLEAMENIVEILHENSDFSAKDWFKRAKDFGANEKESYMYELNARSLITLWGLNGELADYACRQWEELFELYYIPRWRMFLTAAIDTKAKNKVFDVRNIHRIIRTTVEQEFLYKDIYKSKRRSIGVKKLSRHLYKKWAVIPNFNDLPRNIIREPVIESRVKNKSSRFRSGVTSMTTSTVKTI